MTDNQPTIENSRSKQKNTALKQLFKNHFWAI